MPENLERGGISPILANHTMLSEIYSPKAQASINEDSTLIIIGFPFLSTFYSWSFLSGSRNFRNLNIFRPYDMLCTILSPTSTEYTLLWLVLSECRIHTVYSCTLYCKSAHILSLPLDPLIIFANMPAFSPRNYPISGTLYLSLSLSSPSFWLPWVCDMCM
jgi:hypothetical protein